MMSVLQERQIKAVGRSEPPKKPGYGGKEIKPAPSREPFVRIAGGFVS